MRNEIHIGNKEYFYMIDNQIRDTMMKYETEVLLPKAVRLADESDITTDLKSYPIDGYYYKTSELKQYFNIIRNIQENERIYRKIKDTKDLRFIKKIVGSKLFGSKRSNRTTSPLPRMKDIMTLCMNDKELFPEYAHHPWNIEKVMLHLKDYATGNPNLVELAYLTEEVECLVAGCETNILYREIAIISGSAIRWDFPEIVWDVDDEVERLGCKLIDGYNKLIDSKMEAPDKYNCLRFDREPEIPRVARLGFQRNTKENYYWILDWNRSVFDVYTTEEITTESYKNKGVKKE